MTGGGSITIDQDGVPSGTLTIGNNAVVTAQFLGANGQPDPVANEPGAFRLEVTYPNGNPRGLVFTLSTSNSFSGTFTRQSASTTPMTVRFALFHIEEGHEDFVANVSVIVQ